MRAGHLHDARMAGSLKAIVGEAGNSLFWDDDSRASLPLPADHISIRVLSDLKAPIDQE